MRLHCPHCGERDRSEFTYYGDASKQRPFGRDVSHGSMFDYVYLRDNVAGAIAELWYHGSGCHAWLNVTRNTITHEIAATEAAAGVVRDRRESKLL